MSWHKQSRPEDVHLSVLCFSVLLRFAVWLITVQPSRILISICQLVLSCFALVICGFVNFRAVIASTF